MPKMKPATSKRREEPVGSKKLTAPHSFLLVYPQSYYLGMSNLGFQAVVSLVDSLPGWYAERAFLGFTRSLEGGRTFSSFDVVAFSISYELDCLNVPALLAGGKIPLRWSERDERHPLVIAGGIACTINPEPVAEYFDAIVLGEAEGPLKRILSRLEGTGGRPREERLREIARITGVYVPRFYLPQFDRNGRPAGFRVSPAAPFPVKRARVDSLDPHPTASAYIARDTVFPGRGLIEISRGCRWGCRFCAVGFLHRPVRERGVPSIRDLARRISDRTRSLGFVSSSVSDHAGINDLAAELAARGHDISVSSLRADTVSDRLLEALAEGGQKTITLAPEAGSSRLRRSLNKDIPEEIFASTIERARRAGFRRAKLYFLVGLPGETEEDVRAIVVLCRKLAAVLPLNLSVNPFIPKPHTPFQWSPLESMESLRRKIGYLRQESSRAGGVNFSAGSPREAFRQACLSLGDRRLSAVLEAGNWKEAEALVLPFRWRKADEFLPWSIEDTGVSQEYLRDELEKSRTGEITPPCRPETCRTCGVC